MFVSRPKRAFTLVELLVVIAIIGVLVGMLLPAVQRVREAARRASCLNNMRQVVLACHNYQASNLKFPAGANGSQSFLITLLPFLDQQNVADTFKSGAVNVAQLSRTRMPSFLCGSATQSDELTVSLPDDPNMPGTTTHYYGCAGPGVPSLDGSSTVSFQFSTRFGSNPIGLNGVMSPFSTNPSAAPADVRIQLNASKGKNFDDIRDGSSNTVAIGEMSASANVNTLFEPLRPSWSRGGFRMNNTSPWRLFSTMSPVANFNGIVGGINDPTGDINHDNHTYASNHPGGSQFAMADGSARFVNESIDTDTLLIVCGTSDGFTDTFDQ